MAEVLERAESRVIKVGSTTKSLTRLFVVLGTASEDAAALLLMQATVPFVGNLTRTNVSATPKGGGVWYGEVEYTPSDPASAVVPPGENPPATGPSGQQPPGPAEPLGPQYTIDTSAQTVHVTQSLETVSEAFVAPLPGNPDFGRAVNVDKDTVHGVDVYAPKQEWTVQATRAVVTFDYIQACGNLAGKTNSQAFYHYPRGTLLYLGAVFNCGQELRWTVTHKFLYGPNQVLLDVGNGLTLDRKEGHDYVWVGYQDKVTNQFGAQVPVFAKVERMYERGNFALLEIGE